MTRPRDPSSSVFDHGAELKRTVQALARAHGMPNDDAEFDAVVAAYADLWTVVAELDGIPIDLEAEPAVGLDPDR